jgi:hypothetical protein
LGFSKNRDEQRRRITWKAQTDTSLRHSAHDGQKPEFPRFSLTLPLSGRCLKPASQARGRKNKKISDPVSGSREKIRSYLLEGGLRLRDDAQNPQSTTGILAQPKTKNMKLKNNKITVALTCATILGSVVMSQAAVIIQDDFSYPDGGLNLQAGGTGWGSNVWFEANSSVSSGVAVGGGTSASKRNFAETLGTSATANSTNILWVRFDWGHSAQVGAGSGYGGLTFYNGTSDGGSEIFLFGNPWWSQPTDGDWNISGGSGDNYSGISSNGIKSGLGRFDLTAGTVQLWVRATGSTIDVGDPADASVSGINTLAGIKGIRINGYNGSASQSFDNLTIATTLAEVNAIPEPSTALLGGLGLLALLRRRR